MAQGEEEKLMTSEEVAAVLGVNDSRVRQLARAGLLNGRRVGRDWIFTPADVEEYQQRRPPRGRPPRADVE